MRIRCTVSRALTARAFAVQLGITSTGLAFRLRRHGIRARGKWPITPEIREAYLRAEADARRRAWAPGLSVNEAAAALGITKKALYKLMRARRIRRPPGRRTLDALLMRRLRELVTSAERLGGQFEGRRARRR